MSTGPRPPLLLLAALIALTIAGTAVLFSPACTIVDSRIREFYSTRHLWMCAFNALSAACGSGLLSYRFDVEFTHAGRFVLALLSLVGALAGAAALAACLRSDGERDPEPLARATPHLAPPLPVVPRAGRAAACAAAAIAAAAILILTVETASGGWGRMLDRAPHALAAASSAGLVDAPPPARVAWAYSLAGFLATSGWPALLLPALPAALRRSATRAFLGWLVGYAVFLLAGAALVAVLEQPRSSRGSAEPDPSLAAAPPLSRAARSLVLVASAGGAGVATEPLASPAVSDGTRAVLAFVALTGGLTGGLGGGAGFALVALALASPLRRSRRDSPGSRPPPAVRPTDYALQVVLALATLTLLSALGLLILENLSAAPFQPRPTFADAFLDSASAVAGAGLSAGLVRTLTDENLSSGMRQAVDWYPYAAAWLMAAMLVGRVLPIAFLASAASRNRPGGAATQPCASPSSPPAVPSGP